ncbi:MAG TPA: biopolymer transporter ExbD [Candidatus Babeliaceae bacterium]|nr:biopolymer transporter ExbD [Candidatus Babeliaceae bacterium]
MRKNSLRRRRSFEGSGPLVSLTPLIDTALVLLVIFMVATPVLRNALVVNLPYGEIQEGNGQDAPIIISIDAKGTLYINKEMVQETDLATRLVSKLEQLSVKEVFIDADEAATAGKLVTLMDTIKRLGIVERVFFETEKVMPSCA